MTRKQRLRSRIGIPLATWWGFNAFLWFGASCLDGRIVERLRNPSGTRDALHEDRDCGAVCSYSSAFYVPKVRGSTDDFTEVFLATGNSQEEFEMRWISDNILEIGIPEHCTIEFQRHLLRCYGEVIYVRYVVKKGSPSLGP